MSSTLIRPMVTSLIRKFCFVLVFCAFVGVSAGAQAEEDELVPEGPLGRYTIEQGQELALHYLWGEVLKTDMYRNQRLVFYEYTIQTRDGSIYEVEINALSGEIYRVEVVSLSDKPRYPYGMIEGDLAQEIAVSDVDEHGKGRLKPKFLDMEITVFERKLVYQVRVKKSVRTYKVFVDAFSGEVVGLEEESLL